MKNKFLKTDLQLKKVFVTGRVIWHVKNFGTKAGLL